MIAVLQEIVSGEDSQIDSLIVKQEAHTENDRNKMKVGPKRGEITP